MKLCVGTYLLEPNVATPLRVLFTLTLHKMLQNRLRKHYLYAQNPGASLGPQPGLCPGPTGDLKRSQDPLPNFVPLTSNPGSAPVSFRPSVRLSVCCCTSHWKIATLEAPLLPAMGSKLRHFFIPHLL